MAYAAATGWGRDEKPTGWKTKNGKKNAKAYVLVFVNLNDQNLCHLRS